MAREVKKTATIGVRFDKDLLEGLVCGGIASSPQKALNLYEKSYIELVDLKNKKNNEPEIKNNIEQDIETKIDVSETAPKEETTVQRLIRESREKFSKSKK